MSNSTTETSGGGGGSQSSDFITNMVQKVAVNFTPLLWFEQMSGLFCYICNSEDPKVRAASGALNFAIIAFIVVIAARMALWFWTFYKFYIQQQYISAGVSAYESKYKGLWVVVTGGTDGIGLALAKKFAEKKAKLAIVSRTQSKLDSVKEQLEKLGAEKVDTIQCDFSDIESSKSIDSNETYNKLKRELDLDNRQVGIVVNNVGIMDHFNFFHHSTLSNLLKVMDVNFKSAVILSWLVAPQMAKRKHGLFVNVSSMITYSRANYFGLYRESKLAIDGLSEQLAFEYPDLSVLLLHTGPVHTNIFESHVTAETPTWMALSADKYAASAFNIIQASATSPGLTETTGHVNFEFAVGAAIIADALGVQKYILNYLKVVPKEEDRIKSHYEFQSTQKAITTNKDVAETNIDIPLNG